MKAPMTRARALSELALLGFSVAKKQSAEKIDDNEERLPNVTFLNQRVYRWTLTKNHFPYKIMVIFNLENFQYWTIEDVHNQSLLQSSLPERVLKKIHELHEDNEVEF